MESSPVSEFMTLNEITLETASEEYIFVKISDVASDGKFTAQALSQYLKNQNLAVDTNSFKSIDFSQPQDLTKINPETGFIELDVSVASTSPAPTPDPVRPKPQKPASQKPASQTPMTPTVSTKGRKTMFRLFNPNSGEHHYTLDKNEYETLVSLGWNNEGLGWYSANDLENKIPLYRLYNPTAPEQAKHHYTMSLEERNHLLSTGEWNDEGIGWYGIPTE